MFFYWEKHYIFAPSKINKYIMCREDYKNNVWYPLTDLEYWVEEMQDEFPNCITIVYNSKSRFSNDIKTYQSCSIAWGTMAKSEDFYFMIIEKPLI